MTLARVAAFTLVTISLATMGIATWLDLITGGHRALGLFELSATWVAISI